MDSAIGSLLLVPVEVVGPCLFTAGPVVVGTVGVAVRVPVPVEAEPPGVATA